MICTVALNDLIIIPLFIIIIGVYSKDARYNSYILHTVNYSLIIKLLSPIKYRHKNNDEN